MHPFLRCALVCFWKAELFTFIKFTFGTICVSAIYSTMHTYNCFHHSTVCVLSKSKSVLLSHSTQHHTHAFGGDTGHTHACWWGRRWNFPSAFNLSWSPCPSSRGSRSSGQPFTTKSILGQGQDRRAIFSVACFCVGVLCGGNPCEHGENMQTPHRKAREIAHLSTEGEPAPSTNSAPCGNRTQDLLAVRLQCKHWATVPRLV